MKKIWEIRELHRAAKEAGVLTQMGNQGRTMDGQRFAKEWIDQGALWPDSAPGAWSAINAFATPSVAAR